VARFGLGPASEAARVTIDWPDRATSILKAVAVNQRLVVDHPRRGRVALL